MKTPSPDTLEMLQALRSAVAKTLDRKRRLGHYAALWKDGKVTFTAGDRDPSYHTPAENLQSINEDGEDYPKKPSS